MSAAGPEPAYPVLAASVAVFRDGRVLLAMRGRPPAEGLFSLPGGRVEPGETLGEAALRELDEEVGVKAKLIGPLPPVEVIEREANGRVKHHIVVIAHAARWISGEARTGPEAREIRWVTQREIAGLPITAGLAEILEKAFRLEREDAER